MRIAIITSAVAFATSIAAHGGIWSYQINGVNYVGYEAHNPPISGQKNLIQRKWNYLPIYDPASSLMPCNDNGSTLPGSYSAPIKAGDNITARWDNDYWKTDLNAIFSVWLHAVGPMFAYMADCGGDCNDVKDPTTLKWFKIAQGGLTGKDNEADAWRQGALSANNDPKGWTVTIPKNLQPGNYIIRHEVIYLNSHEKDVQYYPSCAHLKVSGSGTKTPSDDYLVKFPGAYRATDPGLGDFMAIIQQGESAGWSKVKYTMPGPKVWTS